MSKKKVESKDIVLLDKNGNPILPQTTNDNDINNNNNNDVIMKSSTAYGGTGATPTIQGTFNSNENTKIKLNERISLDNVGPIVLNVDGSTSYIKDWNQKTQNEQQKLLKFIQKRNKKRRDNLLKKAKIQQKTTMNNNENDCKDSQK